MLKNQIIILIVIIALIFGGTTGWFLYQKSKIPSEEEITEEEMEEMFSLSALVSSVDVDGNFLMVKPANQEKDIKVVLSETTKLIKLEFPFDPKDPPQGATFSLEQTEIEISDFKEEDNIFIKAKENIAGKAEIDGIDFVHIIP